MNDELGDDNMMISSRRRTSRMVMYGGDSMDLARISARRKYHTAFRKRRTHQHISNINKDVSH